MDTKSINKLNDQINVLKRQFTEELNTVNYYYWPLTSKSKKKLGNLKWYFTLACCLFFSVIILLLLHEVTNPYWIRSKWSDFNTYTFLSFKSKKKR